MESLAVGLLILTLTSQWGGFLYLLKKISDVERMIDDKVCADRKDIAALDRKVVGLETALARSGFGRAE